MKLDYKKTREILKMHCRNLKGFNADFFKTFTTAYRNATFAVFNGETDQYYKKGYVSLNHYYDAVYESDFYINNGGTYCEFLSIFYGTQNLEKFRIDYFFDYQKVDTTEQCFEDLETAKKYALALLNDYNANSVEVTPV